MRAFLQRAEVRALISENSRDDDAFICTDGSVIQGKRCARVFTVNSMAKQVQEAIGSAFVATPSHGNDKSSGVVSSHKTTHNRAT